jgi:serine/threonine protein kinase/ankyrin repeat protein
MADLDLQSFPSYKPVEASSELLNPPRKKFVILDQVTFFGLALSCGIPILSNAQGVSSSMSPRDAGSGVSFSVSGHPAFSADILQDFVNSSSAVEWFGLESPRLGSSMEKRTLKIVAKKVITASDLSIDDACYLAAITNEIRILSKQAIRECRQIVALHAISWNELPVFGRCWPQLYLQQADMGSLKNFLDQSDTSITTKMKLGSDIMAGLACVHSQGIVHLDLKPENILIFQDASIKDKQISGASPSVIAKISDFGSAVILADYEVTSFFQYRTGTVGWMSPEMDLAKPTPIQLLYKSDIFSCGLLAASLFAQGSRLLPSETQRRADSSSEADQVWERLCADRAIPDTVAPYVLVMLRASLSSDPGDRFSLLDIACVWTLGQLAIDHLTALEEAPRSYQLLMVENMHQRTVQLSNNPHAQFQHKMSTLVNDLWELFVIEDRDRPNWFTGTMRPLKDIGEWHALSEKGISRNDSVERIKFNDSLFIPDVSSFQLPAHAILNLSLTRGSHKFCFETKFSASTLPRVLVGEIIRNLEERSTQSGDQSKVCLSLAGYYLNETLIDQDVEKGMKYLAKAADQGHLAALEALGSFCTHFKNSLKDDFTESVNRIQISATTMLKGQVLEFNAIFSGNLTFEAHKSTMFIRARQESETSMTQRRDLLIFEIWSQLSSGRISDQSLGASETGDIQDPNQEDDDGIESILQSLPTTPLQRAVLSRDEKLIQRVVEISGGGLEEYGETPGWSPLWLSCLTGDYHTAEYLMQNGANINCSALDSGISILHLLNMFSEPSEIDGVLEFCLRGREDGQRMLVGQKTHKGLTPLHTTFCGYDYSCGYAARALLKHGASPITQTPNSMHGFTPIALCAFSLDYELLQEMLACVWITEESNRSDGVLRDITLCKAFAFRILCNLTQFVLISKLETFEGQLDKIVKLVLDDKTMEFLLGTESSLGGYDPLAMPLWQARPYLALSFLRVFGLPRQISMVEFQRPYLHIAIERRLRSCVSALLERGADILLESQFGKVNALHMAAIWFPEMLLELIDHVNLMNSEDRRGKSAKQILESVTDAGVDVISLLIMEGNKLELDVADKLRRNYNIDLDVVKYQQGDESVTLTGKVVAAIMEDGLIPLSQVEYLLKLKPPPRLVCSSNGRTLLCLASTGRLASKYPHCIWWIGQECLALTAFDRYRTRCFNQPQPPIAKDAPAVLSWPRRHDRWFKRPMPPAHGSSCWKY